MRVKTELAPAVPAQLVAQYANRKPPWVLRGLLLLIGVLLPLITFDTNPGSGSPGLVSRIQPVDFLALGWVLVCFSRKELRIHLAGVLYGLALVVALGIGILYSDADEVSTVLVSFFALSMALVYWFLGYSTGTSRSLVTVFLWGLILSVIWEAVIVLHDYLADSMWFVDTYPGRVRGTFHKNGQLGAFGFSSAGMLLTLGWSFSGNRFWRFFVAIGAVLGVFFMWAAARRSGLLTYAMWGLVILSAVVWHNLRNRLFFASLLMVLLALPIAFSSIDLSTSLTGKELAAALEDIKSGNTFVQIQLDAAMAQSEDWFPFGLGIGRGQFMVIPSGGAAQEIHNGHLALVVETGIMGLLAFYWMAILPVFRDWGVAGRGDKPIVRFLLITFLAASAVFALHNRLQRDRVFMIFLGMATTLHVSPDEGPPQQQAPKASRTGYDLNK